MKADSQLEALWRMCVVEERISVIRHDLRNRLSAIRNGTFYLKRKNEKLPLWETDARVPSFFGIIEQEVARAEEQLASLNAVNDGLDRLIENQLVEGAMRRGLEAAALPAAVTLVTDFRQERDAPSCAAEIALLTRCLAQNAVESLEGGAGVVEVGSQTTAAGTEFWVEDNGPGLPESAWLRALLPFGTQKPGHLGIGLNVARRIAMRHRGVLRLGATKRGGLRVEVCLA